MGTMPTGKNILIVEDSEDDATFLKRALLNTDPDINIFIVPNGKKALEFMFHEGEYANQKMSPINMILLDINLPKINGLEVLRRLRENGTDKTVPIIIFTSSQDHRDIIQAGEYGANSYIRKPSTYKQYNEIINNVISYWFSVDKYMSL